MEIKFKMRRRTIGLVAIAIFFICVVLNFGIAIIEDNNLAAWGWGLLAISSLVELLKSIRKYVSKRKKRKLRATEEVLK